VKLCFGLKENHRTGYHQITRHKRYMVLYAYIGFAVSSGAGIFAWFKLAN